METTKNSSQESHYDETVAQLLDEQDPGEDEQAPSEKKSDKQKIRELIEPMITPFIDPSKHNKTFTTIANDEYNDVYSIESVGFAQWVSDIYSCTYDDVISTFAYQEWVTHIQAKAVRKGGRHRVFTRVGTHSDNIYIDLANDEREVIEVNSNGWTVQNDYPVKFLRNDMTMPLLCPSDDTSSDINELFNYINIPQKSQKLVLAWIIKCYFPNTAFPLLVLNGLQGTAKSTAQDFIKMLIDPAPCNLPGPPKKKEDLVLEAADSYLVSLNNISHLSKEQQDDLCWMATGGSHASRKLYTNLEKSRLHIQTPIIMNGIDEFVTALDLVDRVIAIELPKITDRLVDDDLKNAFKKALPRIFRGLLDLLVKVIQVLPAIENKDLPRMAHYAKIGIALEKIYNWEEGSFLGEFNAQQKLARDAIFEGAPVMMGLINYIEAKREFTGTYSALLNALWVHRPIGCTLWPQSGRGLAGAMKTHAKGLAERGIKVESLGHTMTGNALRVSMSS